MRRRSAAIELALFLTLIVAVLWAFSTWMTLRWQKSWVTGEAARGLSLTSEALRAGLRAGMMQKRRGEIGQTLDRIARETNVHVAQIIDHDGQVRLSTDDAALGRMLEVNDEACRVCHDEHGVTSSADPVVTEKRTALGGEILRAFAPVLAEPGCVQTACHAGAPGDPLGVIQVDLSLGELEQRLSEIRFETGLIAAVVLALGGGMIGLTLSRRIHHPLREVLEGMRRVGGGDLEHRIPVRRTDELGELASNFNDMNQQLVSLQEGLIQSERLISMGKLAAGVAHEINNPLTGILSYAEDLVEDSDPSDPLRKDYEVILHEALRCRQIVRGLLDFARQEKPSPVRARPRDIFEKALDVVVRQSAFRNIRFEKDYEENMPEIRMDPVQIQQVLVNLIINAQQAMPEGGLIRLRVRSIDAKSRVEFSVKDEGTGIPPELVSRIFEPFFSTKGGKTDGLGLAVCLGIVQQHGGTIHVESQVGEGTRFRVVLPCGQEGVRDNGYTHIGGR
jgi:two-component system NtrC family sensor kinase